MKQFLFLLVGLNLLSPVYAADKPNVIFIAVDDLNDWVGCLGGHPQAKTPNIDRLAKRGVLFTNAHCQAPICTPSRTSIMYGLRPSSSGIYKLQIGPLGIPALQKRITLPRHFADHGYRTLTTGKVHHDGGKPKDFEVIGPMPGQHNKNDALLIPASQGGPRVWQFGAQTYDETLFNDHVVGTWAIEQLKQKSEKPFFLAVGFHRPHVPLYAPARFFDVPEEKIQLPIVKENDMDDIPSIAGKITGDPTMLHHDWFVKSNNWHKAAQAYLACIHFMDAQVGRLLDALDASPHAKNTIVVLFSDNGFALGEKNHWGKNSLWETDTRVPLIISAPGLTQGESSPRPAELLSLYPTLIDLCGLTKRDDIEGTSLLPLLKNPQAEWKQPALTTHYENNHSLRTDRYRYTRFSDGSEELYDHQSDPNEWTNLAKLPEHDTLKKELSAWFPKINLPQARPAVTAAQIAEKAKKTEDRLKKDKSKQAP